MNDLLVITDQDILKDSYENVLEPYGKVSTHIINSKHSFDTIDLYEYKIIIADFNNKFYSQEFIQLCNAYEIHKQLIILISYFDIRELAYIENHIKNISFIIKKPFALSKLLDYLDKEILKTKQLNILRNKAEVLIDIIDLHPSNVAIYNIKGELFYGNINYLTKFEIGFDDFINKSFDDITPCEFTFNYIKSKLFITKTFKVEKSLEDGIWYESIFFYTSSHYIIHMCTDISKFKERELQLDIAKTFFDSTNEGMIVTNQHGVIKSVNKAFTKITGYTPDEVIGQNPNILKSGMHDKTYYEKMWQTIQHRGYYKGEIWNKAKDGKIYPQLVSITKTQSSQTQDEYYLCIITDIRELKKADEKVHYYANFDYLTGLPNRKQFDKELEKTLNNSNDTQTQFALFFIDLDKFKEVNDTYGHQTGDKMLITVTKRFLNVVRKYDFIARLGGDEFVLLARNIKNIKDVENLAKKLQQKINEPIEIDSKIFNMTLSIGISLFPHQGTEQEELLKNADIAMYEVKNNGRNGFKIFNTEFSTNLLAKITMEKDIKNGILNDEFVMYYQPIIDVKTNEIIGAESLVRWNHPTKGLLYPEDFIQYISSKEMQKSFGDMIIKKVAQDIHNLNTTLNKKLFFAINIFIEQLYHPTFCSDLAKIIQEYDILAQQIELEILETQLMYKKEKANEIINNLHHLGFKIALDDFGIEYSSLNYLKNFKLDKIKIDQSFLKNMQKNESNYKIVQLLISFANIFGLEIHAEGVETKNHYQILKKLQCDFSQGFYHSKAIPLLQFIDITHHKDI